MISAKVARTRTLARGVLWGGLAANAIIMASFLRDGQYRTGGVWSVVVAAIAWWLHLAPLIEGWLDAKLAAAIAEQRHAERALAEIEQPRRPLQFGRRIDLN